MNILLGIVVSVLALCFLALIIIGIDELSGNLIIDSLEEMWDNHLLNKKQKEIRTGARKSQAWLVGYIDMAKGIYHNTRYSGSIYSHQIINEKNVKYHLPKDILRKMAEDVEGMRKFKPSMGRTSTEYLSGTSEAFQQYCAGGMQLLSDVDDFQAIILEEKTLLERRKQGLEELDRSHLETKRQLDMLRDKTYNRSVEHKEFDAQMLDTPKGRFSIGRVKKNARSA